MIRFVALTVFFSFCLMGCGSDQSENSEERVMSEPSIILGESAESFVKRLDLPLKMDRQPAGVNFYELDWIKQKSKSIKVEFGQYSFTLNHVLGVTGTEDANNPEKGLFRFRFGAGVTEDDLLDHDQARLQIMSFLQSLSTKGWKRVLYPSIPRLGGEQSYRYALTNSTYSADINFTPSLELWMQLGTSMKWYVQADNRWFMKITVRRDSKRMDPNQPGAYYMSFILYDKEEFAKSAFAGERRDRWQELWVDEIKRFKRMRYQKEAELIQQGYQIDTDYQDPIVHPEDPVEPDLNTTVRS